VFDLLALAAKDLRRQPIQAAAVAHLLTKTTSPGGRWPGIVTVKSYVMRTDAFYQIAA
jgi:hypothetical protein